MTFRPISFTVAITAFLVLSLAALVPTSNAAAGKSQVFTGIIKGVAVGGYDPVAYFTTGKPSKGNKDLTLEHDGAIWRFASTANRDAFKANPEKYAPQYGGYCSWAVSQGYTAKGDPKAWRIVDGKLYLNYNRSVQKTWERNIPTNISKANANWPNVLKK